MERMVNRVFVIGNLGDRSGRIRGENSMKIIQHALQQHIDDVPIHFLSEAAADDFLERKAMDEFADNCIYIVENLNFYPEEFSCVEAKPDDEGKEAKGEMSKVDPTPLSKNSKANLPSGGVTPAGEDQEKPDNEEDPDPAIPPPFTVHSIHNYKRNLSNLADLYINDAPMASLTASNSVNEIACKQKIMGMKMTESLRSIAQFFMKQFPLDVHSIYYKQPTADLEYFACKSTAVIGGATKGSQDIIDKIILANSFLDTFERIIFVVEVALACLHALGISPGKIERSESAIEEYEGVKEFILMLFERSVAKQVEIVLPVDYVTAEKGDVEEIKAAAQAKAAEEKVAGEASGAELAKPSADVLNEGSVEGEMEGEEGVDLEQPTIPKAEFPIDVSPNFQPKHWADAQIYYGNYSMTDLSEVIAKKFEAATAHAQKALASVLRKKDATGSSTMISKQVLDAMSSVISLDAAQDEKTKEDQSEANPGEEGEAEVQEEEEPKDPSIPEGHTMLCYGPKTIELIQHAINGSFKLFWDGSVSLYIDNIISSKNNKDVLNTLLEMRNVTQNKEEPPVTLLHGDETEKLLRITLMRIKIEQQEAVEAAARAKEERAAYQEDEDSDDMQKESEMEMQSESEDKMTTFDEDLEIVTDFGVFDSSDFTTKVM